MMRFLFCLFLLVTATPGPAQDLAPAVAEFARGNHDGCLRMLDAIHQSGRQSPESWLLEGNARALAGDTPGAMLAYRRALALDPLLPEASQNLAFLTNTAGVPQPPKPPRALALLDTVPRSWLWSLASIGFWLALFCATAWVCLRPRPYPRLVFSGAAAGLLCTLLGAAALLVLFLAERPDSRGATLLWKPDAQLRQPTGLRSAPARRAKSVLESLPAGTPVRILRTAGWAYVEAPSGPDSQPLRGWLEPGSWSLIHPVDGVRSD